MQNKGFALWGVGFPKPQEGRVVWDRSMTKPSLLGKLQHHLGVW